MKNDIKFPLTEEHLKVLNYFQPRVSPNKLSEYIHLSQLWWNCSQSEEYDWLGQKLLDMWREFSEEEIEYLNFQHTDRHPLVYHPRPDILEMIKENKENDKAP